MSSSTEPIIIEHIIIKYTTYTPAVKRAQNKYISKVDIRDKINIKNKERMRIRRLTNPEYRQNELLKNKERYNKKKNELLEKTT
jgi:hypothetical protein